VNCNYMKKLIISALTAFLFAGCASMGGGNSGADVLASGNHSNMKEQEYLDIHNQADFDAMWKKAFAGQSGAPDKPAVDFSKDMVLAAFIGDQPTAGYEIRFKDIDTSGTSVNATLEITRPGQNCLRSQAAMRLTDPFLIVAIPASTKPVNFNPVPQTQPACGGG
jgi:PrcB C-terminal